MEGVLGMLKEGKFPDINWVDRGVFLPFRFMKSEHLIYALDGVSYYEQRTKREIVGRSAGTSVRIMRGVSVRVGQSRGTPVETDQIFHRGLGTMAITTKHLYYCYDDQVRLVSVPTKSFRIRLDKIVSITPFSDGISITRDRANAQPEYFEVEEGQGDLLCELIQLVPSLDIDENGPERESPAEFKMWTYDSGGEDGTLDEIGDAEEH